MTGEGTVISVSGSNATVAICKASACSHDCGNCKACANPSYSTTVTNTVGAKPGDRVVIETDTSRVLGVSFLVYMLPVLLLIVAAVICDVYNLGAIVSALLFAVLILLWIVLIRFANKKVKINSEAVSIINTDAQKD